MSKKEKEKHPTATGYLAKIPVGHSVYGQIDIHCSLKLYT